MKGLLAWIIFGLAAAASLYWISSGVRDDLRENAIFKNVIEERGELARDEKGDVVLGLAGNWSHHEDVLAGARLAARELNEAGGVLGRRMRLLERDDEGDVKKGLIIAQELALMPEVSMVVGHTDPLLNRFVAPNYEFYDMLLLSPCADLPEGDGPELTFTNALDTQQMGQALLDLADLHGFKRLGLVYARSAHYQTLAQRLESLADARGVGVPLSFAFRQTGAELDEELQRWKRELNLDAMVLSLNPEDEQTVLRAIRAQGITLPVVCTANASLLEGESDLGEVWMLQPYALRNPKTLSESSAREQFRNTGFSLGYESVMLLGRAMKEAKSAVSADVASALRELKAEGFPAGTVGFGPTGRAEKLLPRFVRLTENVSAEAAQ